MDDGWVYPLVKTLPSLVINLWWNIVINVIEFFDEKTLVKWQYMQHYKSLIPKTFYKD